MTGWLDRHRHRGIHGEHVDRQRRTALLLIATGVGQACLWSLLLVLGLAGVPFAHKLFRSVAFISAISVWALALACWAQVAGSLAQLTAGDAHHDVEQVRKEIRRNMTELEEDVARLAELSPCDEAYQLRDDIRRRLRAESGD